MLRLNTPGIILKRRNYAESDRIITIFTLKLGKVVCRGRALRKPLSKLAGHLELFTESNLNLTEGKIWYTITEAVTLNSFPKLRSNIDRVSQAHYLVELVDRLTHENEPMPKVYDLLKQSFDLLNAGYTEFLETIVTWNLLGRLGYQAELFECVECRKKLVEGDLYFSTALGGILDNEHQTSDGSSIKINDQMVKLLRLTTRDVSFFYKLKLDESTRELFKKVVDDFTSHVLDRQLKSLNFLNSLKIK